MLRRSASLALRDSVLRGTPHIYVFYPLRLTFIERNVFYRAGGVSIGTDEVRVTVRNNLFMTQTTDYAVEAWAACVICGGGVLDARRERRRRQCRH